MIKSFSNGLKIFLDKDCTFAVLSEELRSKFTESAPFFKGGKIAISLEGRSLSPEEEKTLVKIIEEAGQISVLYVCGKDELTNENYTKAINSKISKEGYNAFGKIYPGSIKKGEFFKTENSIVVVGDIEPGATISAKGSIIVLGGLYGSAFCELSDADDYDKCFIFSNEFCPEKIRIGEFNYLIKEKVKWVVKPKFIPRVAFVSNYQVSVETVSPQVLSKISNNMNLE